MSKKIWTSSVSHEEWYGGNVDYFLIALFENAIGIKIQFESGKVRENWVRKPYGWDGIELGTCVFNKDSQMETGYALTNGSLLTRKYRVSKRESTTKNPARNDSDILRLNSDSSAMVQRRDGGLCRTDANLHRGGF